MGRTTYLKKLRSFRRTVEKTLPIDKMILFGSRAWGKPKRWSDFDILVVSKRFRRRHDWTRTSELRDAWTLDYPVDFLCYTPEEFRHRAKDVSIVALALKKGIEIR